MTIVQHYDFNPSSHAGFKKFGIVKACTSVYGKRIPMLSWVFFADETPTWALPEGEILVNDLPDDVHEGYAKVDNGFISIATGYRQLHTDDELYMYIRKDRDTALNSCDWLVSRHISQPENAKTLTEAQYAELQGYMQALRDFPANVDLDNIIWPPKPAFIL